MPASVSKSSDFRLITERSPFAKDLRDRAASPAPASPVLQPNNRRTPHQRNRSVKKRLQVRRNCARRPPTKRQTPRVTPAPGPNGRSNTDVSLLFVWRMRTANTAS
ncbi:hypothetical protein G7K_2265-t1 [Saitoella complicata NRRL Y-17804]|uniref:Uncharacterized protein n=1 Tax=Saitoella complicata (strain BCRC 22490 / CBS 7301 / JCM 7358 / NBRC 10748 / NRRL Y-17804) TaxID=698492 RepID=A0A0E9NE44_SAICN|nr:hypothetical protein G7K_2265-t1 [Saitoella complicata NRRL Y-17804]